MLVVLLLLLLLLLLVFVANNDAIYSVENGFFVCVCIKPREASALEATTSLSRK